MNEYVVKRIRNTCYKQCDPNIFKHIWYDKVGPAWLLWQTNFFTLYKPSLKLYDVVKNKSQRYYTQASFISDHQHQLKPVQEGYDALIVRYVEHVFVV